MTRHIIRRFVQAIPTLFGVTLISYLIMAAAPGGPAELLTFGLGRSEQAQELKRQIEERWGLNDPWIIQYLTWLTGNDWMVWKDRPLLHSGQRISDNAFYNQLGANEERVGLVDPEGEYADLPEEVAGFFSFYEEEEAALTSLERRRISRLFSVREDALVQLTLPEEEGGWFASLREAITGPGTERTLVRGSDIDTGTLLDAIDLNIIGVVDPANVYPDVPSRKQEVVIRYADEQSARADLNANIIQDLFIIDSDFTVTNITDTYADVLTEEAETITGESADALSRAGNDFDAMLSELNPETVQAVGLVDPNEVYSNIPSQFSQIVPTYESEENAQSALESGEINRYYIVEAETQLVGNDGESITLDAANVSALFSALNLGTIGILDPGDMYFERTIPEDLRQTVIVYRDPEVARTAMEINALDTLYLSTADYRVTDGDGERIINERFVSYGILRGDFGDSIQKKQPAMSLIWDKLPATVELGVASLIVSVMIGIPIGIFAAIWRGSTFDNVTRIVAVLGNAIPNFWFGLILLLVFSFTLEWLPTGNRCDKQQYSRTPCGEVPITQRLDHMILPTIVLSYGGIAGYSRFMRTSMLDTISSDYIRTARAKGLPNRAVWFKHAARNSLIPIATFLGPALVGVINGAAITEAIFTWPGLGRLFVESITARDYPIVMASVFIGSVLTIVAYIISDILYALFDPRIRF
mgnify:CR=1 FL=1